MIYYKLIKHRRKKSNNRIKTAYGIKKVSHSERILITTWKNASQTMSRGIRFRAIKRKAIFGFCSGGDINGGILILLYSDSINRNVATQIAIKSNAKNFRFHLWWNFPEFDLRFIRSNRAPNLGLSISNSETSQCSDHLLTKINLSTLHSAFQPHLLHSRKTSEKLDSNLNYSDTGQIDRWSDGKLKKTVNQI